MSKGRCRRGVNKKTTPHSYTPEQLKKILDTSVDGLNFNPNNSPYYMEEWGKKIINALKNRRILWVGVLVQIKKNNLLSFIPHLNRSDVPMLEQALNSISLYFGMTRQEINNWETPKQ